MATTIKHKAILFVIVFSLIENVITDKETVEEKTTTEELEQSETKDGKLEIIKQIKRINDDGSYTIGYEADDGTFKIESRDVLGNIKGTYGYIDESGQIKRVSYSTSNTSDVTTKPTIAPTITTVSSVVQRIPKVNRTLLSSTRRPIYSTTPRANKLKNNVASSTTTTAATTTPPPPITTEKIDEDTPRPTQIIYATPSSRILLQSRPIVRSTTPTSNLQLQKSEGQLIRPDIATELPLFKRLALKHPILNDPTIKPVVEDDQQHEEQHQQHIRNNILRRQLSQDRPDFDPQQHVFALQQSLGNDVTDVYSASVTAGTPRPLFTTTQRPRGALLSSTATPVVINRPHRYQDDNNYAQETTTTESAVATTTTTPVPVVQVPPANQPTQEPLVAIRHPFQRGTILVPLSQIQNRVVPDDDDDNLPRHPQQQPIFVRRLPPQQPQFRPVPVQVDENGFIREVPPQHHNYPVPVPITPPSPQRYDNSNDNDIEKISPPVSTRDFQKLLQQLILRQSRLERISELTNPRRRLEYYQQQYRPAVYRPAPYYQRVPQEAERYVNDERQGQQFVQQRYHDERSYIPTRRVARLLQPGQEQQYHQQHQQDLREEYLPPDVREMLLLRMLQLAINPALPLNEDDFMESTTPVPQYKKVPVRNVEILGEEGDDDDDDQNSDVEATTRTKRYKQTNYY